MLLFFGCKNIPDGATAVQPFDQQRYLGTWYEIARFDFRFERNLRNVTATYSLRDDGLIKVDNRGYDSLKKEWKQSVGKARPAGDPKVAMLKVSFFGPFYAGYNVIALDAEYKYALVAGQSLEYLWILSREKTIPDSIRNNYLELAKKIGYDTSRLVWVNQGEIKG